MLRSTQLRFATFALFVAAAVSLTATSAGAFSQQSVSTGGNGNSAFADPDDQVNNFGSGAQPFGRNGPIVQFGVQQGPLTPFGHFQGGSGYNPMPLDPYTRSLTNGN